MNLLINKDSFTSSLEHERSNNSDKIGNNKSRKCKLLDDSGLDVNSPSFGKPTTRVTQFRLLKTLLSICLFIFFSVESAFSEDGKEIPNVNVHRSFARRNWDK